MPDFAGCMVYVGWLELCLINLIYFLFIGGIYGTDCWYTFFV